MRFVIRILFLSLLEAAASAAAQNPAQSSTGGCSPNVNNTGSGPVTIQFIGTSCQGIDPLAVKKLNDFLATYPKQVNRLLELLDKKDADIDVKVKEIAELTLKYDDLSSQIEALGRPEHIARSFQMNAVSAKDREQMDSTIRELEAIVAKTHLQVTPENLVRLGWYCIGIAQYEKAAAFFLQAKDQNPSLGSIYLGLSSAYQLEGTEYLRRGEVDKAKEVFDKAEGYVKIARQYDEFETAALVQLGYTEKDLANAYAEKGMTDKSAAATESAARHFREAAAANPQDPGAHNGLGDMYAMQGHMDLAIGEYQSATTLEPTYTFAWFDLALALRKKYETPDLPREQKVQTFRELVGALEKVLKLTQDETAQRLPPEATKYVLDSVKWVTEEAKNVKKEASLAQTQPEPSTEMSKPAAPAELSTTPAPVAAFKVSGVGSPGQTKAIEAALAQYDSYLRGLGVAVPAGTVQVQVTPQDDRYVSYYDPTTDTIYVNVQNADSTFWPLRDYTFRALNDVATRPELVAILSGLATYYPSSSRNDPNYGPAYGGQLDRFHSLTEMRPEYAGPDGSSIWGSACWELRTLLGSGSADALLLQAWEQMRPSNPAEPDAVRFVSKIIDLHRSNGGKQAELIRLLFERRGVKL
jgi:tetratricopeptide (TPR) repeat protein